MDGPNAVFAAAINGKSKKGKVNFPEQAGSRRH